MNQNIRNKKNANYAKNLEKRYGQTKSSDWKLWSDNRIKIGTPKKLKHEFKVVCRHGLMISREFYLFEWTPEAREIQKIYHATKNGIPPQIKKPLQKKAIKTKEERLKEREFSKFHKLLIDNAYANNKQERIMKQQAQKVAHEEKIRKFINKFKTQKQSIPFEEELQMAA